MYNVAEIGYVIDARKFVYRSDFTKLKSSNNKK